MPWKERLPSGIKDPEIERRPILIYHVYVFPMRIVFNPIFITKRDWNAARACSGTL